MFISFFFCALSDDFGLERKKTTLYHSTFRGETQAVFALRADCVRWQSACGLVAKGW
jgi:hypothetical protein